jgi:hypothetical protein
MILTCFHIKVSDGPRCKAFFDCLMLIRIQTASYCTDEGFAGAIFLYNSAHDILLKESHEGTLKEIRFENLGCHPNKRQ